MLRPWMRFRLLCGVATALLLLFFLLAINAAPTPNRPKAINVLVIDFDPVLYTRTNLKLHEYFKWSDPWKLTDKMIEDARVTSHGFVNYRVVQKIEHDGFTRFRNGFMYTEQSFLEMWEQDRSKRARLCMRTLTQNPPSMVDIFAPPQGS